MSGGAAVARQQSTRARTVPVVEIFGPTLQGEGPQQGRPAYFVRFGGCDYRCTWCDSMHAVEPSAVRANARHLSAENILDEVAALAQGPSLVVLSGGNPALLELGNVVAGMHDRGYEVAVETQGSRWKAWLADVDCLVVSPKAPSSGMDSEAARADLDGFMDRAQGSRAHASLKVVIFDDEDLDYARWIAGHFAGLDLYLSVGTPIGGEDAPTIGLVLKRLRWLSEATATDRALRHARVSAQQHVLTWGTRQGV